MTAAPATTLEQKADAWVGTYRDAHHLRRTRDWLLVLEPGADEALRIAALTHDMERHYPGGPQHDPARHEPGDAGYDGEHQERSAVIVERWLLEHGAEPQTARGVAELVRRHEVGGDVRQDLVQAADSLSFLETKRDLMLGWLAEGRCGLDRACRQPRWMFDRIRLDRARPLAGPLLEETIDILEAAAR
jgi:hypothetical protein